MPKLEFVLEVEYCHVVFLDLKDLLAVEGNRSFPTAYGYISDGNQGFENLYLLSIIELNCSDLI